MVRYLLTKNEVGYKILSSQKKKKEYMSKTEKSRVVELMELVSDHRS